MKNLTHSAVPTCLALILAAAPLQAGLLAYYPFDSDFTDASGNGNDLTIAEGTPAVTTTVAEFVFGGGAANFISNEGDQHYLTLADRRIFSASDPWSISFWGRRAAGSTNRQGMIIGDLGSSDFIWLTDGGGGVNGMRFRNSSGGSFNNGTSADNAFPDDGNWHHWVLVADGAGNLSVYRDNASLGTVPAVTTFDAAHIGQAFTNSAQSMNGQIDELYLFDSTLDATDVADLFNDTTETTAPTLASGDIVDDQGGGTITVNTEVTYTVTFSEDISAGSVDASDFGNSGASISISAVTETAPGVFEVTVMPTGAGALQLELVSGATVFDCWGNALDSTAAILDDTTLTVVSDLDPPTVSTYSPANGASNRFTFTDLSLTFSELVQAGTGNITIHEAGGAVVETIDVNSGAVGIVDDVVTINPLGDLLTSTSYYVTIDAGAIEDLAGNDHAGIADDTTWTFTTSGPLIAYYPFDADFADASGLGNDLLAAEGTPTITTAAGESVVGGGAVNMSSSETDAQYLALTTPLTFPPATPWSISFWGRRAAGSTFRQGMIIGDLTTSDFIWLPDGGGGVNGIRFRNSFATSIDNGNSAIDAFPDDGEWHHWALVADGAGNLTIFRDNSSLGAVLVDTSFDATHVGQGFNSTLQSMNGQIDELYIYNKALDTGEVAALFDAGAGNTFASWIAGFNVGGLDGFTDDADGDGNGNGLENFFGTAPDAFSAGLLAGTASGGDFLFSHPQSATPADDIAAPDYTWSTDLLTFHANGDTVSGSTVDIVPSVDDPVAGTTTVTASVTGTPLPTLFLRLGVTQVIPPPPLLSEDFEAD